MSISLFYFVHFINSSIAFVEKDNICFLPLSELSFQNFSESFCFCYLFLLLVFFDRRLFEHYLVVLICLLFIKRIFWPVNSFYFLEASTLAFRGCIFNISLQPLSFIHSLMNYITLYLQWFHSGIYLVDFDTSQDGLFSFVSLWNYEIDSEKYGHVIYW